MAVSKSPSYCSVSYCSAYYILEQCKKLLPEGDLLTTNQGNGSSNDDRDVLTPSATWQFGLKIPQNTPESTIFNYFQKMYNKFKTNWKQTKQMHYFSNHCLKKQSHKTIVSRQHITAPPLNLGSIWNSGLFKVFSHAKPSWYMCFLRILLNTISCINI